MFVGVCGCADVRMCVCTCVCVCVLVYLCALKSIWPYINPKPSLSPAQFICCCCCCCCCSWGTNRKKVEGVFRKILHKYVCVRACVCACTRVRVCACGHMWLFLEEERRAILKFDFHTTATKCFSWSLIIKSRSKFLKQQYCYCCCCCVGKPLTAL